MDSCVTGSICFEMMKGVPAAFVTLIIGGIAGLITYRQYKVAQAKLKLDLFERRYAIFRKVWKIVSVTWRFGARQPKFRGVGLGSTPFNNFRPEAVFLFGKGMEAYIDELVKKWLDYHAHEGLREEEAAKNAEQGKALQDYFFEQADHGVKDRFSPFLDFANWK
jgi:hypothetical protein